MERYEEIKAEYRELFRQQQEIQNKMNALAAEWRTEGLASIGLKVGDVVFKDGYKFSVSGLTNNPPVGEYHSYFVDGCKIKKDGTPSSRIQFIGHVTAKDKVEA